MPSRRRWASLISSKFTTRLRLYQAVQPDDFQHHAGRLVEVVQVEPFVDSVDGTHAGAEVGAFQPLAVQDVSVTTAHHRKSFNLVVQVIGRFEDQFYNRAVRANVHGIVGTLDVSLDAGRLFDPVNGHFVVGGGFPEAFVHVAGLGVQPFHGQATSFRRDNHFIRHDITRPAAVNRADIGDCLVVHTAKLHFRNRLAGNLDGAHALFGGHGGVGLQAVDSPLHY